MGWRRAPQGTAGNGELVDDPGTSKAEEAAGRGAVVKPVMWRARGSGR